MASGVRAGYGDGVATVGAPASRSSSSVTIPNWRASVRLSGRTQSSAIVPQAMRKNPCGSRSTRRPVFGAPQVVSGAA